MNSNTEGNIETYCTLRGRIKGTVCNPCCIRHTARVTWRRARYTVRHVITVTVLAFLTQENKAGKMQSTINQLKHGKGRAVRAIMAHREGKGWGRERGGRERGRGREREGEEEGEGEGGEGRKEEGEGEGGREGEGEREGREGGGRRGRERMLYMQ